MASPAPLHAAFRRNIHTLLRQHKRQRQHQHHQHNLQSTKRTHSSATSASPSRPQAQTTNANTTSTNTNTTTPTTNISQQQQQQQHHTKPQSQIPLSNTVASPPLAARPLPTTTTTTATTIWQRLGPLTRAGEAYARAQRRRPYVMQTAATLVIYCAGDLVAQYIGMDDKPVAATTATASSTATANETTTKTTATTTTTTTAGAPSFLDQYDPIRTLRSMSIGGLAAIPGWHWFLFLSNNFNYPGSRALSIFVKVAINQIVFTPLFNTYFFGAHSLLAGATPQEALERIQRAVPVSMVNSVKLWPAVTAFSFAFIPIEFRSLFAGGIAIGWQAYLSALNKRAAAEAAALLAATGSTDKDTAAAARKVALARERLLELEEQELVGAARVAAAC